MVVFGNRTMEMKSVDSTKPVLHLNEVSEPEVLKILQGLKISKSQDGYGLD